MGRRREASSLIRVTDACRTKLRTEENRRLCNRYLQHEGLDLRRHAELTTKVVPCRHTGTGLLGIHRNLEHRLEQIKSALTGQAEVGAVASDPLRREPKEATFDRLRRGLERIDVRRGDG